jgi:hypothetical protein
MLKKSDNEFWFTPNNGDLDMPERNLSFRLAEALADSGFDILHEVGSLLGRRRFDLVAINWNRKTTLLCEAKLLYSGKNHASNLESDVKGLERVRPIQFKLKNLPRANIIRMVIASTWTRYHLDSMRSLDKRLDKTREELVSRWTNPTVRKPPTKFSHSEFNSLLSRLDDNGARFAVEPRVISFDKKKNEAEKQNLLMAAW